MDTVWFVRKSTGLSIVKLPGFIFHSTSTSMRVLAVIGMVDIY